MSPKSFFFHSGNMSADSSVSRLIVQQCRFGHLVGKHPGNVEIQPEDFSNLNIESLLHRFKIELL